MEYNNPHIPIATIPQFQEIPLQRVEPDYKKVLYFNWRYTAQKYQDAITYFNKSIAVGTSSTGKSEYYLGLSYLSTGKKTEACNALQLANNKKYPDAAASIKSNCQ